jgi:hypothetical protein
VFATTYGIFRDELYYLACAARLDWGYVDHPPLVAALTALWTALFGDGLLSIRLLAALAGAGTVAVAGTIARRLGGGNFAVALTGVAVGLSPIVLGLTSVLSMNVFDLFFWALACRLAVGLLDGDDARLWLAFGAVAGVGLQNKLSVLFLGFGLVVGLVAGRRFATFREPLLLARRRSRRASCSRRTSCGSERTVGRHSSSWRTPAARRTSPWAPSSSWHSSSCRPDPLPPLSGSPASWRSCSPRAFVPGGCSGSPTSPFSG